VNTGLIEKDLTVCRFCRRPGHTCEESPCQWHQKLAGGVQLARKWRVQAGAVYADFSVWQDALECVQVWKKTCHSVKLVAVGDE
jgi:hypothetical protein